jgi:hypothetical protein
LPGCLRIEQRPGPQPCGPAPPPSPPFPYLSLTTASGNTHAPSTISARGRYSRTV